MVVHDWQLALLRTPQDFISFRKGSACRCGDKVCSHNSRDWIFGVSVELDVSAGDDAEKFRVEGSLLCGWNKVSKTKPTKMKMYNEG